MPARGSAPAGSREIALTAGKAAAGKQAADVTILDVHGLIVITDYFVICSGQSDRQVKTIVEEVEKAVRELGERPIRRRASRARGGAPRLHRRRGPRVRRGGARVLRPRTAAARRAEDRGERRGDPRGLAEGRDASEAGAAVPRLLELHPGTGRLDPLSDAIYLAGKPSRSTGGKEAWMLAEVDITIGDVIIYIVAGLVIGVIARALLPGRQSMSIVMTIVIGVIAAVVGGLLWEWIFPDNDGIAWIGSIIVGVVLVWLYARSPDAAGRPRTDRSGSLSRGIGPAYVTTMSRSRATPSAPRGARPPSPRARRRGSPDGARS